MVGRLAGVSAGANEFAEKLMASARSARQHPLIEVRQPKG